MKPEIRCKIEIREDQNRTSPGRIVGTLINYGAPASDRRETFAPDSLQWPEDGIILNVQHDRSQPVLRFAPQTRDGAVIIDAPLPDTTRGRDAAVMVRNGTFRGLSVEFVSQRESNRAGLRQIDSARLVAAALVDDPSYTSSTVQVRHKQNQRPRVWL